jgi:hypothetical protein
VSVGSRKGDGGEGLGLDAGCSVGGRALMPGTMRGVGEWRRMESVEWWGLC